MELTPERLELASYPFVVDIPPRFGDMDALQHLNNVALAGIYEEARMRFSEALRMRSAFEPGHRVVIGQINIRYLREAFYPQMLTAGVGVLRIGRSSYAYAKALFQADRCVGLCDTTLVHTVVGAGSAPLPEAFRARLQSKLIRGPAQGPGVSSD